MDISSAEDYRHLGAVLEDLVERGWELVMPLLEAWGSAHDELPLTSYAAGSWGPAAASHLTRGPRPLLERELRLGRSHGRSPGEEAARLHGPPSAPQSVTARSPPLYLASRRRNLKTGTHATRLLSSHRRLAVRSNHDVAW